MGYSEATLQHAGWISIVGGGSSLQLNRGPPRRLLRLYGGLAAANLGAWAWALIALRGHPLLIGTAAAAYGFGLRHAVDADHIAAIDNITRKLMQQRRDPTGVGLYFALGHSSIVMLASLAVALTATGLGALSPEARRLGADLGTAVSFGFLWLIGTFNLVSLRQTWRALRTAGAGATGQPADLERLLAQQGVASRWLEPLFRLVGRSRHVFAVGALFGLGFDTASEVLLLGISAEQAYRGASLGTLLLFPVLFAAGMSLLDTTDGVLMTGAYGFALLEPIRKLRYNIIITCLSVAVAYGVGGAEALGLMGSRVELGGLASLADAVRAHMSGIGCGIIAAFLACWLGPAAARRLRGGGGRLPVRGSIEL
jgi:high-affinity nickel-transport protein